MPSDGAKKSLAIPCFFSRFSSFLGSFPPFFLTFFDGNANINCGIDDLCL